MLPRSPFFLPLFLLATVIVTGGGGCGAAPQLMPTPNLYVGRGNAPFADVPPELRSNRVEVLYVTDRAPEQGAAPGFAKYGHRRSRSVAFGVCEVQLGENLSWDQLVAISTTYERSAHLDVAVTKTTELCRFPPTPRTLIDLPHRPGQTTQPTTVEAEFDAALDTCRRELRTRLAHSPVKDVYVYIHGVKNGFKDSVMTIAQLWHFLGRQGVAVAYTWPAGGGGILRGYNYDYNSSEFTVYHLKQTLRAIAGCPEVAKIHIIAHSRGTDAIVSALRELHLEISGGGRSTRDDLKLGTLVLAAPDLDVDVIIQRAATARLGLVPERAVIYICQNDNALGLSSFLFKGMRLGSLKPEVFTAEELKALRGSRNLAYIDARVTDPGSFGHSYFYENPAVSSDLILLMRYHLAPGAQFGRPLQPSDSGFWVIGDKYARNLNLPATAGAAGFPATRPVAAR